MILKELLEHYSKPAQSGVPDWLLGCFRRQSIMFANGLTDTKTQVYWLQSRNFTIDIRIPIQAELVVAKPFADYSEQELLQLADYDAFSATTDWNGGMLKWRDADAALQIHNRWTEPATLKRVGNCMIEFCPSDAYIEDWRLLSSNPGPLIGLRLIEERELESGIVRHKGGGLIVCGDYAGLVLGRAESVVKPCAETTLKAMVEHISGNLAALTKLFNFETSVAHGSLENGFSVRRSTLASRVGESLFPLDGFELPAAYQHEDLGNIDVIRQKLAIHGKACERLFLTDTIEPNLNFSQATASSAETQDWFERESAVLTRYTEILS